jgi:predicted transcriptional regulator
MDRKDDNASVVITIALPSGLAARVDALAQAELISRTAFIRRAVNSVVSAKAHQATA